MTGEKNRYTTTEKGPKFYLFTMDQGFKKAFESQGIEVIIYSGK